MQLKQWPLNRVAIVIYNPTPIKSLHQFRQKTVSIW